MLKMSEFADYDGLGLADLVKGGKVTPTELKDASLEAIEILNPKLNSVVTVLADEAQKEIEAGLSDGPFKGVPFVIKELIAHAAGVPMHMGSKLAEGLTLPHDTELMARFRKAGLVTVATTTTPEFGFNANTEPVPPRFHPESLEHRAEPWWFQRRFGRLGGSRHRAHRTCE